AAQKMAQEAPGQTLQPTALVHEAYLRLVGVAKAQHWDSRRHFFAAAAEAMSPEQAEMSQLGIDTRSDVYSLGVLRYELLTGTTPLERHRLREAGFDEIRRLIREAE